MDSLESLDYSVFAQQCVAELKDLQGKFQEKYDLDWYENWFYNQTTGLLTFSTDKVELNFKYFSVGTFSLKSNTWKWAWDNDTTLDNVKEQTKLIKEFGEQSRYSKLTDGYFPSDEYEAWEFTAIAAKLTQGICAYRPVNDDQLQMYFVITEYVDNETAKKIKSKYIECEAHEYRRTAFVCQHLNLTEKVGFEEAFETYEGMELGDDDDLQAWCDKCEIVRNREGGWNEVSQPFAKIKPVCEKCYFEMKELNIGYK